MTPFKYLGRLLIATYDDINLQKAQKSWARMLRILGREGVHAWTLGCFYFAIVKAVLLFGAETWVMNPCIGPSGSIPTQGGTAGLREAYMEPVGQYLVISPSGGGYTGSRLGGYGDLHIQAP